MSAISDLSVAVSQTSTNLADLTTAISAIPTGGPGTPDSAIAPITAQVVANNAAIAAASQAITNAVNPVQPAPAS